MNTSDIHETCISVKKRLILRLLLTEEELKESNIIFSILLGKINNESKRYYLLGKENIDLNFDFNLDKN